MTIVEVECGSAIATAAKDSDMMSPNLSVSPPRQTTAAMAMAAAAAAVALQTQAATKTSAADSEEASKAGKLTNFSIAALMNKDEEAQRRKRLAETVPILGKTQILYLLNLDYTLKLFINVIPLFSGILKPSFYFSYRQ
jgi:hypothetical protein